MVQLLAHVRRQNGVLFQILRIPNDTPLLRKLSRRHPIWNQSCECDVDGGRDVVVIKLHDALMHVPFLSLTTYYSGVL